MHVASSVFALIFSDVNTFHVQGKIEMVYRIFAIMAFPCYLILGNKILECAWSNRERHVLTRIQPWLALFLMHRLSVAMMLS